MTLKLTRRCIIWVWDFKIQARMGHLKLNHKINSFLCQIDLNLNNIILNVICICYSVLFVSPSHGTAQIYWQKPYFSLIISIYIRRLIIFMCSYILTSLWLFSLFFSFQTSLLQSISSAHIHGDTTYAHKQNT